MWCRRELRGKVGLHEHAGGIQVSCRRLAQLEYHGKRFGEPNEVGHRDRGASAPSSPDVDEALEFEDAQRLAQRRAGDAERLGQLVLGRQAVADRQLAIRDTAPDRRGDRLTRLATIPIDRFLGHVTSSRLGVYRRRAARSAIAAPGQR